MNARLKDKLIKISIVLVGDSSISVEDSKSSVDMGYMANTEYRILFYLPSLIKIVVNFSENK